MTKSQKTNRNTLFSIVTITFFSFFCLIASEVVLRIVDFNYHFYPERVLHNRVPSTDVIKFFFLPDKDVLWLKKDWPALLEDARKDPPDIVFLGCSCTHNGKYPEYVKDLLEKRKEIKTVKILNAGVIGWSSYQGLQLLKREILDLKPKIVTIYFGWNDHWRGFGIEDKEIANLNARWYRFIDNFKLAQLASKAYVHAKYKNDLRIVRTRVTPEDFRKYLTEMVTLLKNDEIVPVLVTAPTSYFKKDELFTLAPRWAYDVSDIEPFHLRYAQIVRDVAKKQEVILVDLLDSFNSRFSKKELKRNYIPDAIHMNKNGDKLAAEEILKVLEESGALEVISKRGLESG